MSAAGPPQGANNAPFGGSAAATAASVGVHPWARGSERDADPHMARRRCTAGILEGV